MCFVSDEQDDKVRLWQQTGIADEQTDMEDRSTNRETAAAPPRKRKPKGSLLKRTSVFSRCLRS